MGIRTVVAALIAANVLCAQWARYPTAGVPRTPDGKLDVAAKAPRAGDGKVDLSGVWQAEVSVRGTDGELLPPHFIDVSIGNKDGVQMQSWAADLFRERQARFDVDDPQARCKPLGMPRLDTSPIPIKIVQTPGLTLMLHEIDISFRQIFTDGRPHTPDPLPAHMGYSTGRWDGETLVVDTIGFADKGWLDSIGHPHSDALRVTERFRRPDFGHLEIAVTIDDAKAYKKPFTMLEKFHFLADSDLLEYVCSDNEIDTAHFAVK
jgi:hypothetical protein